MILTVTLNPSVDQTLYVGHLEVGDTNRVQHTETDAGGKGANLSRVAAEFAVRTVATGFLGGHAGLLVRHVLEKEGVEADFVPISGHTRINYNIESQEGGPPTTLNSKGPQIQDEEWQTLLEKVERWLSEARWLAIGGSQPPGLPPDAMAQIEAKARAAGVRVLVDADGEAMRQAMAIGPDLIKPNAKEAGRLLGRSVESEEETLDAARELLTQMSEHADDPVVVISRGKAGAVMATKSGPWRGISPQVVAKSTVGSGDSLLAGMLAANVLGESWQEALRWGLAAGAATATTNGAEIARRSVIDELLPLARVEPIA